MAVGHSRRSATAAVRIGFAAVSYCYIEVRRQIPAAGVELSDHVDNSGNMSLHLLSLLHNRGTVSSH